MDEKLEHEENKRFSGRKILSQESRGRVVLTLLCQKEIISLKYQYDYQIEMSFEEMTIREIHEIVCDS